MEKNDAAVEVIASSPTMMAVLGSIPTIGGAITSFVATHAAKIQTKRFERAIAALDGRVENLEDIAIGMDEEVLYDAFWAYFEASIRIDNEVMQGIAADILTGRFRLNDPPPRPVERSLAAAAKLLPIELQVCRAIFQAGSSDPGKLGTVPGVPDSDVRAHCEAIVPTGLLREAIGFGGTGYFRPTSMLRDLMHFLETP